MNEPVRLELQPEWVEQDIAERTRVAQLGKRRAPERAVSTSALARDWQKMAAHAPEQVLLDLRVPAEEVEKIVQLTEKYIKLCDNQELRGGGFEGLIRQVYKPLEQLSRTHRQALSRDWLTLHRVVETVR